MGRRGGGKNKKYIHDQGERQMKKTTSYQAFVFDSPTTSLYGGSSPSSGAMSNLISPVVSREELLWRRDDEWR